jgi:hypothetical protein
VRAVFLILLAVNLLFLAWARWIDTPSAAAADGQARLPRLQLASEAPQGSKPTSAPSHADDPATALTQKTSLRLSDSSRICTSVGPFNDLASAARAAGLLTQRGFSLRQRAEEGETIEGYWVFVGGMQSDDDVNGLVARLEKSGFTDAHVMRNYSTNRRVSVGMFSSRERAEKRAAAVRNLGLQPEIGERRFPGTVYWVDVVLERGPGFKQLPPEYSFADIGHAKVQMQPCPAGLRPREPLPDTLDEDGVMKGLPRTTVASAPRATP